MRAATLMVVVGVAFCTYAENGNDVAALRAAIGHHFTTTQPYVESAVFDGATVEEIRDKADPRTRTKITPPADVPVAVVDLTSFGGVEKFDREAFRDARPDAVAFWLHQPVMRGEEYEVKLLLWNPHADRPLTTVYSIVCPEAACRVVRARSF